VMIDHLPRGCLLTGSPPRAASFGTR
jgi:hypothetical protein